LSEDGGASRPGFADIIHIAGERLSRYEFAVMLAEELGVDRNLVKPVEMESVKLVARRPRDSSLDTSKAAEEGLSMLSMKECIKDFIAVYRALTKGES